MAKKRKANEADVNTAHPDEGPRSRNATATREAILQAAREAFARDTYERVGVREIATAAQVDAALVSRYFGSKEQLFIESVKHEGSFSGLISGERFEWGEKLVRLVLQKDDLEGGIKHLLILVRSSGNETAGMLLRRTMDEGFVRPLAAELGGEDALARAGLIAAYLTGLMVMHSMIGSEALATTDRETLVALAAPVLQSYIDGPPAVRS